MPLAILRFSSIEDMLEFIEVSTTPLQDTLITYGKLSITAAFSIKDIELAKSAYGAGQLDN
jgi:hypothetical protein